jgi:hypothetical protein
MSSGNKIPVNSNDINIMWETWKTNINKAATNTIGMKKKVRNYKHFWNKELDGLIKSRKAANRLKRTHDKTRQHHSELDKLLSESYKKRKQAVQHAIQNKISADRLKNVNN